MIQRIQTVYLLIGTVLSMAMFFSGLMLVSDGTLLSIISVFGIREGVLEIEQYTTPLPVVVLSGVAVVLQGYAIGLFKDRKKQAKMVKISAFVMVLAIGWIGYMYYDLLTTTDYRVSPLSGTIHPILVLFADILAIRGINKDEALVRSVDRLR